MRKSNRYCINDKLCEYYFCTDKNDCFHHEVIDLKKNNNKIPKQPIPITVDNYHLNTKGTFNEIKFIPNNVKLIFKSKGSEYYTDKKREILIRRSNHWGSHIKHCCWYLKGYPERHCSKWYQKKFKIGVILFIDLTENIIIKNERR